MPIINSKNAQFHALLEQLVDIPDLTLIGLAQLFDSYGLTQEETVAKAKATTPRRASDDVQFYCREGLLGNGNYETLDGYVRKNKTLPPDPLPDQPLYPALNEQKLKRYIDENRNELIAGFRSRV